MPAPSTIDVDAGEVKRRYAIGPLDPTVLFVGRMVVQKGPDILVRAMPSRPALLSQRQVRLCRRRPHARTKCAAWPISSASPTPCACSGDRRGRELHDLFKACDIVAVPSRNEPFGIVILEGWSAHKPVVSTKRGGPAEFVWHGVNGLQVDDTPDSVAWGLGTLLADHDRCRWMGRNGRAAVDAAFSWDQHRRADRRRLRQRRLILGNGLRVPVRRSPRTGGDRLDYAGRLPDFARMDA